MSKSVSNDALWEKLSEVSERLNSGKQKENVLDFSVIKDEIIAEMKERTYLLGKHNDSHFEANGKNIQVMNENIIKVLNVVNRIRKYQKEPIESQKNDRGMYFNFRFFKVKKISFVIVLLGLLVFILTLFCMKLQGDYALLMNEYHKQSITIQKSDKKLKIEEKYLKE